MNTSEIDIALLVVGYSKPILFEKAVRSLDYLGLPKSVKRYGVIDGPKEIKGDLYEKNRSVKIIGKKLLDEGHLNSLKIRRKNLGTMKNMHKSVTEILRNHKYIFVLEDDLEVVPTAKGSITIMLSKLNESINSFSIYCHNSYTENIFYSHRYSSQAWGTSRKAWLKFNPLKIKKMDLSFYEIKKLNRKCGSDIYSSFKAFKKGSLDTWAVPWNIYNFKNSNMMVYPPKSYILNNSHLIGAERTEGIEFKYHIAKYLLQKDYINPQLNKRYLTHFSIINRIKRYIFAKIFKYKNNIYAKISKK